MKMNDGMILEIGRQWTPYSENRYFRRRFASSWLTWYRNVFGTSNWLLIEKNVTFTNINILYSSVWLNVLDLIYQLTNIDVLECVSSKPSRLLTLWLDEETAEYLLMLHPKWEVEYQHHFDESVDIVDVFQDYTNLLGVVSFFVAPRLPPYICTVWWALYNINEQQKIIFILIMDICYVIECVWAGDCWWVQSHRDAWSEASEGIDSFWFTFCSGRQTTAAKTYSRFVHHLFSDIILVWICCSGFVCG